MQAMRFVDDGLGFFVGEIGNTVQHAVVAVVVAVVGIIFDPVGAVRELFAHGEPGAIYAVDQLHAVGKFDFPVVIEQRIHAGRGHGAGRGENSGAGNLAAIDSFLHVDVGVHGAFSFKIAQS